MEGARNREDCNAPPWDRRELDSGAAFEGDSIEMSLSWESARQFNKARELIWHGILVCHTWPCESRFMSVLVIFAKYSDASDGLFRNAKHRWLLLTTWYRCCCSIAAIRLMCVVLFQLAR